MNRKQFMEKSGATCNNWNWSWSFVNHEERIVIFGAFDTNTNGDSALILSSDWEISRKGRKQPGYAQAIDHITLISEKNYSLKTFPLIYTDDNSDTDDTGPAKIAGLVPELSSKSLAQVGSNWYAIGKGEKSVIPEEIPDGADYFEGAQKTIKVNSYERSGEARNDCIAHYGTICQICEFDFERVYGVLGKGYIHVHHLIPISKIGKTYKIDPIKDLLPVCANCHAIIHRSSEAIPIEQLRLEYLKLNGT
jgi:5-methylcytosine-specific restriction protein A